MSESFQYMMMVAFIFDSFNVFFITINRSKSLRVKSNFKLGFFSLKKFIKDHASAFIIFVLASISMIFLNHSLWVYFMHLLLLPLIIPFTHRFYQVLYLIFCPLMLMLLDLPFLIPGLFIFNLIYFYKKPAQAVAFDINDNVVTFTRYILPFIFIALFIFETHAHTLFQQILILGMFVLVISLESSLTETKALLNASKNRYMLWHIKSKNFNLKFLNHKNRVSLYQQLFMICYLGLFISLLTRDVYILLIMILACLYLLLSEFDKMIKYKFFNQSVLYDDFISRFIFSQLILCGISFYLLYLGFEEVIALRELNVPAFFYFKFVFMGWYCLWIIIFYKRFDKKISLKFLKVSALVTLLCLSGCSNQEAETFTLVKETITFTGNMVHQDKQEFMIQEEDNANIVVSHGDFVKKGDVLYSLYDAHSNNEIKRINFRVEQINTQINDLNSQIKKEKEEVIKDDLKQQVNNLKNEIELLQFDKNLISTNKTYSAKFDGQIYLKDGLLQVFSNELVLNLALNEHEYRSFNEFKTFKIMTLDNQILDESDDFIIHFLEDVYIISFDAFKHDCYVNQTLLVEPAKPLLFIPEAFVRQDNDEQLVQTENTEVIIKAKYDELKKGYYVKKGLKEGDIIYSYEKDD